MKKILSTLSLAVLLLALVPSVEAQTANKLEVKLTAFNITQNQDATKIKNKAGDVIRYTADVRNLGPGDLVDYEMKVNIKELLTYGSIVDLGGGVIEGDYIKFPPILQAFGCNCSNANYFKVKIKDNICPPNSLTAKYESATTTIQLDCELPPETLVPETPENGPEMFVIFGIVMLLSAGTFFFIRKRA